VTKPLLASTLRALALNPTNEDQKYGGFVGDAATFELGNSIFESLSHLPLASRMIESAKALKVAQDYPVLAHIAANAVKNTASTLAATGDPKAAAIAAFASPALESVPALYRGLVGSDIQPALQKGIRSALSDVADEAGVPPGEVASVRDVTSTVGDNILAKSKGLYQQVDKATGGKFAPLEQGIKKRQPSASKHRRVG
jgi:hypothetical protein